MRRVVVATAGLAIVLALSGCEVSGTVVESTPTGTDTCRIVVRLSETEPDGTHARQTHTRRARDCRRCPVGAQFPECLKKE